MIDPDRQELSEMEEKAVRLVKENRVRIHWIEARGIAADGIVEGDHGTYATSFSPISRVCTCPAGVNLRRCSHSMALALKVASGRTLQLELL